MVVGSRTTEAGRAVVLLSGGLDSATTMAIARAEGNEVYALSVRYGQRHGVELEAARRLASGQGVKRHIVMDLDLRQFGGSALTDEIDVPTGPAADSVDGEIPITYVPARNTIFLSLALAWAEVLDAGSIYIGVNALDYSGYPDCRPEFLEAYQRMADLATRTGVENRRPPRIRAPLIHLTKAEIIRRGFELGVDYGSTISCYDPTPEGAACGECAACRLRRRGFAGAGVPDPTKYITSRRAETSSHRVESP
jgi:7-cyano-7-deazaguanine synthase